MNNPGLLVLGGVLTILLLAPRTRSFSVYAYGRVMGGHTTQDRLQQFEEPVGQRLRPRFAAAGVAYPPKQIALLGFKEERQLEVYARNADHESWRGVLRLPVLAASGQAGPKLREGDKQVPEGLYRIESLNPNSRFHLSLRVDYPNAQDRERAALEGRTNLGGDIMIHGSDRSVGCLAIGDSAIEELFVLVALTESGSCEVLLCPRDLRRRAPESSWSQGAPWMQERYTALERLLRDYAPFD